MSMEQETLIYVEENDRAEARVLAQSFAKKDVKSRAYINALGAELGKKYLALESINNSETYNIHSVHKILEEFDISDIMLSNIHLDVRVVFDENYIFIPKSHFEYDILPDAYLVLLLSEDHSHASFLGFFEPKLINKNNQNSKYYFIEKEKLTPPSGLKSFVENFKGNTTESLSAAENEKAEILMVSMVDQNLSDNETKELLRYLKKSADLRDKFIEFENFELLSYKAEHCPDLKIPQVTDEVPDTTIDDLTGVLEQTADEVSEVQDLTLETETDEEISGLDNDFVGDDVTSDVPELDLAGIEDETALEDSSLDLNISGVASLAEDVAGGLAAAGLASAAEFAAETTAMGAVGETVAEAADAVVEGTAELLSQNALDLSDNTAEEADNLMSSDIELSDVDMTADLSLDSAVSGMEELQMEDLSGADILTDDNSMEIDAIQETKAPLVGSFDADVSVSQPVDSEMTDIDQLAAVSGSGNFDNASLDDLMMPEEDENGELNSIEALQEENARKKGLLDSFDDDSLLESSLDFSKVEAVPQIDTATLSAGIETVDISGFDAIAPEVKLSEPPQNDDSGILDISDVNAVPNNFGDNISETVEMNNFEVVDTTCENESNNEKTQPTADFGGFGSFEPLVEDDVFAEGIVDMDSMSLSNDKPAASDNKKRPSSPAEVDLTGFQSLDMEDFQLVPQDSMMKPNNAVKQEKEEDFASALLDGLGLDSLDSLPNLDGQIEPLGSDFSDEADAEDEKDKIVAGSLASSAPGEAEMLSFDGGDITPAAPVSKNKADVVQNNDILNSVESVEDLSVDDIVDSPEVSDVNVDLISQTVDMEVAQDSLLEGSISVQEEISDISSFETPDVQAVEAVETVTDDSQLNENSVVSEPEISEESAVGAEASQDAADEDVESIGTPMDTSFSESDNADLSMLFDDLNNDGSSSDMSVAEIPEESFVPTLPHLPEKRNNGKGLVVAAAVLVALVAAGAFFGLNMHNKNALAESETLSQPIPEIAENPENAANETTNVQENNENIMANAPEVIDMPQNQTEPKNVQPAASKEVKPAAGAKPINPEGSVISVKKLSWQLPDYLSYSQEMKKYLQTAGKSIKLTLTSDLLLASEYAYSNQVRVSLKLSKEGNIQDSKIVKSSGSTEIDDIVLRTVKETLNVVKPAQGEVPTPDFNLGLIINF